MVLFELARTPVPRVLGVAAILVSLGCSACIPALPLPTAPTPAPSASSSSNTIRIGKAVRGDLNGQLTYSASIQARGQVTVVPRVIARVNEIKVDVGSRVRAGDVLAELDQTGLQQDVLAEQAAQASAEARLAALKAGPKPEVLAQAQANQRAAQARVNALQSARSNSDIASLDARVKEAQSALDQAQAALTPDASTVAEADAAAAAAHAKLTQLQADPTKANDKAALDAARADITRLDAAATAARKTTGSQSAVDSARRDLQDAQQAQLLVRLSSTAFDLDQARALLDVANAQVDLANAPASAEEIKAAETTVEQAFAQAELARSRLRDATISAPIDGVIVDLKAAVGATVGPSAPLLTMIPPDMQAIIQADENQLSQVQVGQSANVSVESFPTQAFSGTVKAIAPVLDPRTHSLAVQIDVSDPQAKLKPGMLAQLAIQVGQRAGVLMVPKDAVLRVGSVDPTAAVQSIVYTVSGSRIHKQVVSLGIGDAKSVEIVQGLQEGVDLVLNPRPDFVEGELISAA